MALRVIVSIVMAGLLVSAAMFAVYLFIPRWIANHSQFPNAESYFVYLASTRASLATLAGSALSALAAITAIGALYSTYLNYLSSQDKQLSDALAKATELLGSEEMPTRLGGIYVLRRIARNSVEDYKAATQILSGHVKHKCRLENELSNDCHPGLRCPSDLQSIFTILGERPWKKREGEYVIDLEGLAVHDASFVGADLTKLKLNNGRFVSVDFGGADLTSADLSNSHFNKCSFADTNLRQVNLNSSVFENVSGLSQEQLDKAQGDARTMIPGNLNYPRSWNISNRNRSAG